MMQSLSLILLTVGIFNGLAVSLLLLTKCRQKVHVKILAFFVFILALRTVLYLLGAESVFDPHSWLFVPPWEVSLAYGPAIFLYLTYCTQRKAKAIDLWHFMPLLVQILYYSWLLVLSPQYALSALQNHHLVYITHLETLFVTISLCTYLYLTMQKLNAWQSWLERTRSDAENYRLNWLRAFTISTIAFALIWFGFSIFNTFMFADFKSNYVLFAAQSLLLTFLAFESWKHADLNFPKMPMGNTQPNTEDSEKDRFSEKSDIVSNQAQAWIDTLKKHQWWKEQDLTLPELAKRLGTNSNHLSAAINRLCGENFNGTINRLRVEYLCQLMEQDKDNRQLLSMAFDAGFNSKNSFNRNFKKIMGLNPTQYKEKIGTKS